MEWKRSLENSRLSQHLKLSKFFKKIATPKYPSSRPPASAPGATPENGLVSVLPILSIKEQNSATTTRETTPDQELEGTSMKSHILGIKRLSWTLQFRLKKADLRRKRSKPSGIRRESVNYVGYYSAHEETMKSVIQSQVNAF